VVPGRAADRGRTARLRRPSPGRRCAWLNWKLERLVYEADKP